VRPYAFAALAICASILCLLRLRHNTSNWLAALFGFSAGCILYFQTLFGVMLPLLLICFFYLKRQSRERMWPQLGVALAVFAVTISPTVPRLALLFHSGQSLAFEKPPGVSALIWTIAPLPLLFTYAAFLIVAAIKQRPQQKPKDNWRAVVCVVLGVAPITILYLLSISTPLQVFVARYRLVALPGIALCWALLVSVLQSRWLRLLFCVGVVLSTGYLYVTSPYSGQHGYTWKYALEFADHNASADNASLVICSDFPQSPFLPMPVGDEVKDSALFTQLSYYIVSEPVVGLPRSVNDEAIRDSRKFLDSAQHSRFLALGFWPSYPVLQMLSDMAAPTHEVRLLGTFNDIRVLEFTPRQAHQTPR
jgi:hypothetical protein